MVKRKLWLELLESAWAEKSVVWLAGVRRAGKTCLCQSLPDVEYFDCELPRVRRQLEDAEDFLGDMQGKRVALDEVHRLPNPSELLKIAADHFPRVRLLVTGSSTLGATAKFRDTLTGRKRDVMLTPMTMADQEAFGWKGWKHRFLHGGLPPFYLAQRLPERDFQEWMDAYWAKDVQELFRLERRNSFLRFFELVLAQSGGIFEASKFSQPCEVSRTTISNYLGVLETTLVVHVVRPFSTHKPTEIVAAPKVYGFDTGFVCAFKGWSALRPADMGPLWEHIVLNEFLARPIGLPVCYWRDKRGHEVDFVLAPRGSKPLAVECKWSAGDLDPAGILAFRHQYPEGQNLVVAHDVNQSYTRKFGDTAVRFVNLAGLLQALPG
ncbi:MAG: AAA family ATPase [bacterium]